MTTKQNKHSKHKAHDHLIKKLLSNPAMAKDILSAYLPIEVRESINLDYLELQRDTFIDDEHREFEVDLLYKTQFNAEEGYFWILAEHQRNDDPWLPLRIFKYMSLIWDHLRHTSKNKKLPLVFPFIIYNGDRPYSHSLVFRDLIEPESSRIIFDQFFKTPITIIDLAKIKDQNLQKQAREYVRGITLLLTLKHVYDRHLQHFLEEVLIQFFQQIEDLGYGDDVYNMIYYLLNQNEYLDIRVFFDTFHGKFSPEVEGKIMTAAEQLRQEGKKIGLEEGMIEVEEKVKKEKVNIAKRLLAANTSPSLIEEVTGLSLDEIMID